MAVSIKTLGATALLAVVVYAQATTPVPSTNSSSANSSAPRVDLGYVKYQGRQNATAGINYFRGIPYAVNPTGPLRWQKPIPIESMNDFDADIFYDASNIGPACYQSLPESLYAPYNESFAATPQGVSEDCLTVDVLVPTNPVSKRLPVMFQIHGGGYTSGNAQSYPGDAMVHASNGKAPFRSRRDAVANPRF